jgi:glycosyltransferase involved in cell wall biosynthesis
MRIAYVTDQLLPQTATDTEQMMSMIGGFEAAGADVTLVKPQHWFDPDPGRDAIADYYQIEPTFEVAAVRSVYPNIRGIEKVAQGLVGPRHAAARQADVLYTRTLPILLGNLLVGTRPIVYETYRPWPRQQPWSAPIFRWIARHPRFLGAVLHSDLARTSYEKAGVDPELLLTAHNGYDPDRLAPTLSRSEARARCDLPADRPTVTYAGRVTMDKGLGLMLDMARALPAAQFVVVGSEGRGEVERKAAPLDNVRVVPWQPFDDTVPFLYAADVLLIPPTAAPLKEVGNTVLPMKTFLYMAAGRAILAPASPDLQELLRDGENAALVPPDDPDAAVRRLRALLNDPDHCDRLGTAARADIADHTWPRRADRVLRFVDRRLAQRTGDPA